MARRRGKAGSVTAGGEFPEMAFDPIKAALRQIHDSVAAEGIPADFVDLLDRLDKSTSSRKPN